MLKIMVFPARDGKFSNRFTDDDMVMLLESRVQELLAAEAALRQAQTSFDAVVVAARGNHQGALVDAALAGLLDRRPPA